MKKIILLLAFFTLSSCSTAPKTNNEAINNFSIDKYLGKWYEIVRYDHSFEKGCEDVYAIYKKKNDHIKVVNRCLKNGKEKIANGIAHFKDNPQVGHLKVSFFRPFYGNYKIIYLDKNYQYAIIDGGTYDYFWLLARENKISSNKLEFLLKKAEKFGYDRKKMIFTKHK